MGLEKIILKDCKLTDIDKTKGQLTIQASTLDGIDELEPGVGLKMYINDLLACTLISDEDGKVADSIVVVKDGNDIDLQLTDMDGDIKSDLIKVISGENSDNMGFDYGYRDKIIAMLADVKLDSYKKSFFILRARNVCENFLTSMEDHKIQIDKKNKYLMTPKLPIKIYIDVIFGDLILENILNNGYTDPFFMKILSSFCTRESKAYKKTFFSNLICILNQELNTDLNLDYKIGNYYKHLPEEFKNDKEFVLWALELYEKSENRTETRHLLSSLVGEGLRNDKEFLSEIRTFSNVKEIIDKIASEDLKNNKDFMLSSIKMYVQQPSYKQELSLSDLLGGKLKDDKKFILKIFKNFPPNIPIDIFLGTELKKDREFMLEVISVVLSRSIHFSLSPHILLPFFMWKTSNDDGNYVLKSSHYKSLCKFWLLDT